MQFDDMTDYVVEHTGIKQRATAIQWLEETLTALAKCLTSAEAQRLALELPAPASHWIRDVEHQRMFEHPDALYELVERRLGVPASVAVERAQVALLAMARMLRNETRQWLAQRMGDPWSDLFEEPDRSASRSRTRHPAGAHETQRDTLAEGRPGSDAPLSESSPKPQPGSVGEDNPYEDRKVSSAKDVQAEPISSGKPGSARPVSESE